MMISFFVMCSTIHCFFLIGAQTKVRSTSKKSKNTEPDGIMDGCIVDSDANSDSDEGESHNSKKPVRGRNCADSGSDSGESEVDEMQDVDDIPNMDTILRNLEWGYDIKHVNSDRQFCMSSIMTQYGKTAVKQKGRTAAGIFQLFFTRNLANHIAEFFELTLTVYV